MPAVGAAAAGVGRGFEAPRRLSEHRITACYEPGILLAC
jgi:hypothetical protein